MFLVMFLFLQNWRYTIIPTIVVPIALLGTFAALLALGFSINVLTMFGMVLVIGIVVDDAIVVVENVERIMSEEGLPPLRGHAQGDGPDLGRHHRRDGGADLGVRAAGLLRRLHRQHLPPVLGGDGGVDRASRPSWRCRSRRRCAPRCSSRWKPATTTRSAASSAGSTAASRAPPRATKAWWRACCARAARYLMIYAAIIGAVALVYTRLPTSFLPQEDQGNIIVNVQLPPGATQERTLRGDGAGRGLHPQAARSAEHGGRAGLQLLRPGPERRPGLRDAQGLGRAQGRRPVGRGAGRPRLRRAVGHPRRLHLPAEPAADSRTGHGQRLHLPPAGPRRRRATRRWSHARNQLLGMAAQEQAADAGAPGRPGRRAAAADRHRPRQGATRWA